MALSPCGWKLPITSPTALAHLACGLSGRRFCSYIEYRIRRCTGLSPSRTSGSARDTITDMEYSRKERSISSWISMGSIAGEVGSGTSVPVPPSALPPRFAMWGWSLRTHSSGARRPVRSSDVEEAHILCVGLNEVATQLDVVTHDHRAHVVGLDSLLHADLQERPASGVHGGIAKLAEVHLSQSLQALEVLLVVGVLGQERRPGGVVFQVDLLLADEGRVQRRLRHVHEPTFDERLHLPEEEGEQQGPDVRPVDIGVGQDDDLVVPDLGDVELVGQSGPDGRDQRLDLGVLEHLVDTGPLDVQDLAADRQDGLQPRVAGVLG